MPKRLPTEIAEAWYREDSIAGCLSHPGPANPHPPEDTHSPAFAKWLTEQYRLAMAKGIQLTRSEPAPRQDAVAPQDTPESLDKEVESLISRGEDIDCTFETTGNGWGFRPNDEHSARAREGGY